MRARLQARSLASARKRATGEAKRSARGYFDKDEARAFLHLCQNTRECGGLAPRLPQPGIDRPASMRNMAAMFPIRDHNPSGSTPYVTLFLVGANVLVFLACTALNDRQLWQVYVDWGLVPQQVMRGQGYQTLISHMFLHSGWMHLIGNMLFLWIFGDNLEDEMGRIGFLLFYLAGGLAAAGLQIAADPGSPAPMIGASGAVAGVMGGYLLLYPKARVDVLLFFVIFFRVFALRAWIVLVLWFALQLFSGFASPTDGGGVAYWAHVGGFAAGGVLTLPFWLRRGGRGYWQDTEGHPPHPQAQYPMQRSTIPRVPRR